MHAWLRRRLPALRLPWPDVALAVGLTVAALVAWRLGHGELSRGPRRVYEYARGTGRVLGNLILPARPTSKVLTPLGGIARLIPGPDRPVGLPADPWAGLLTMLITVPVAWRRRLPLAALGVQFVGVLVVHHGVDPVTLLAVLIGSYSLAAYGRHPMLSLAVLAGAAALVTVTFSDTTPPVPTWATPFEILVPIGLAGTTIRAARARADASAQRALLLEREQEVATAAAVAGERARIARELHDVVSHHVSVMTIQAGAAGKVIDTRPDLARDAVGAIETSGREAMAELRHLLGLLTPAPAEGGAPNGCADPTLLAPQPGLDQLLTLVEHVRAAGQPVTVRTVAGPLPRGVELAAYRVVQEGLTNALRYAPGARTEVVLTRDGNVLVIDVTNDGIGADPAPAADPPALADGLPADGGPAGRRAVAGGRFGLLGLAERLRLYDGTLQAGRRLGGGFRLHARLPLEPT